MATFKELNLSPEILKSLKGLGYEQMTDVQERVIPEVLKGNDVVVKSKREVERRQRLARPSVNK